MTEPPVNDPPVNDPPEPFPLDPTDADASDPLAQRLRAALHREADMVRPSDDGYDRISTRIRQDERHDPRDGRPGRPWVAWVAGLAAAVLIGTVAGVLVVNGRQDDGGGGTAATGGPSPTVTGTSPAPSPTGSGGSSTSAPPTDVIGAVPVYWIGDSKTDSWLVREFQEVPDVGGTLKSAVQQVMSGDPLDPDYRTAWSPPSSLEVTQDGDALTVDVSADAFANTQVGSKEALLAVQQVVWTATAAAQASGPVTILVDGAAYDAWGAVALGEPMTREADLQAQIWIDTPNQGSVVPAGEVTVRGVSTAFEATVAYEVVAADGSDPVVTGSAMGGANGTFAPYEVTVDLEPGEYTLSVWEEDMSDGESAEGPRMFEQTRTFTVR